MKRKTFYTCFTMFIFSLFFCTIVFASAPFKGVNSHSLSLMSRAMTDSDPNRDSNWRWYEYQAEGYDLYAASGTSGNGIITYLNKQLPFFSPNSPAGVKLYNPDTQNADMYPEDGWVLLKRDFGTPGNAPLMPYFFLYNKARGILRYVFFNSRIGSDYTYGLVKLCHLESGNVTSSLIFDDFNYGFSDAGLYDADRELATVCKIMPNAWSFADFTISYDPNIKNIANAVFVFEVIGVHESSVKLDGNMTLNQVFRRAHLNTNSATDVIGAGKEAYKTYSSANKLIEDLTDKAAANPDAWYSSVVTGFNNSGISGYVGAIAGAAKFINAFVGGGKSSQAVPLYFEGDISLKGTITEENPVFYNAIKIPGSKKSPNMLASLQTHYDKPLGIFSLRRGQTFVGDFYKIGIPGAGYTNYVVQFNSCSAALAIEKNNIPGFRIVSTDIGYAIHDTPTWVSESQYSSSKAPGYRGVMGTQGIPGYDISVKVVVEPVNEANGSEPVTIMKKYRMPIRYVVMN